MKIDRNTKVNNLLCLLGVKNQQNQFKRSELVSQKKWGIANLEDWQFTSNLDEAVPGYFLYPSGLGPFPTLLYCHAHGEKYDIGRQELLDGRRSLQSDYGSTLVNKGFALLCLEMPCFGGRQFPDESSRSKAGLWRGKPLFGQMISELLAGIEFLNQNPLVDSNRIGTLGISMGGTHAWWLASLDERISASVNMCCFADLNLLIQTGQHDGHGQYMTVPGLLTQFSTGQIAGLTAPRPQLVCVGLQDWSTPAKCFSLSRDELMKCYKKACVSNNIEFFVDKNAGHEETAQMREKIMTFLKEKL